MKTNAIMSKFGSQRFSIDKLEKIIDKLEKELQKQKDRANGLRDNLVKLDRRLGYLECAKHSYKFTCLRRVGELRLWSGSVLVEGDQGYVFTCVHCLHEVVKLEKDLTPTQRRALHTLKILEVKDVSKKR